MKNQCPLTFLTIAFFLVTFQISSAQNAETQKKITQVENGLSHYHQIKGEPTWTIAERMEHYGVPGMSIAVIHDYKIAWTKTYGIKDKETKEPVTENTLFQAASISKPVSAYAALSLVKDGELDLDKNVNDYLKSWSVPENEFTKEEKVTLRYLLSHKAGLTVHGFLGYSPGLEVPTLVQLLEGKAPANSAAIQVDKTPGGEMRYSGGGYCAMQQMMIDLTGKTYSEIMQERVLKPIGMTKSTFAQPLSAEQLSNAATGYLPDGSVVNGKRHTYPEMAAAGLWTNAAELAKFVIDLQQTLKNNTEKVLSHSMAKKMVTPAEGERIGLGIFLTDNQFGHGGWNEGFSSDMIGHLEDGYGVVIMLNANQPSLISEVRNSVARVYGWEKSVPPPHEKLAFTATEIKQMSGNYAFGFDEKITVYQEGEKVFLKYLTATESQELIKIADNTYVRREKRATIQFLKNPKDNHVSMVFLPEDPEEALNYSCTKVEATEKLGIEWIMEGNIKKGVAIYEKKKQENPEMREVQEGYLNNMGYQHLGQNNIEMAMNIFRLNVGLYPESANVYDSLGEACLLLATKNYEKAVSMDAKNVNAKEILKRLKSK